MANTQGASILRTAGGSGKQSFLPPKSPLPLPGASHVSGDYGSMNTPRSREGNRHHQRTSSASFLIEEQPSWLDDLLNEPDTPVKRGAHRRSSSDSFAYLDLFPSHYTQEAAHSSHPRTNLTAKEKITAQSQPDTMKNGAEEFASQDRERSDGSNESNLQSELDPKRVKQKFAQRSRVRKLQYIAELERNVQALMAELSGFSAELGFLDQQNIILSLENKALRRRLDSLNQEKLLKCVQQETLEREISRLRAMYQQQRRHLTPPTQGQTSFRDLDSLLGNLSLNQRSPIIDGNQ